MNFNIVTEYPLWLIPLCFILGFFYAFILYFRERKNEFRKGLVVVMSVLRFLAVTMISFFLLSPMMKSTKRIVEKPIIILAQDNSRSVILSPDSSFYKSEYLNQINQLVSELSSKYNVVKYTFGDKLGFWNHDQKIENELDYSDKQTDYQALIEDVSTRYANRNVGAMILASDGIYNKGINPIYLSSNWRFPLYTIAMGDTSVHRDLILSKVNYNRIAYLGNQFPIEVIIVANKASGTNTILKVMKNGEVLVTKNVDFIDDHQTQNINIQLVATETGIQKYSIQLLPVKDEKSVLNNRQDIYIDVLDSRQKILLLANSPHPDISAMKQAIEANSNFEVDFYLAQEFTGTVDAYNLLVLHQIPSGNSFTNKILDQVTDKEIPILFILGTNSNLNLLNNMKMGLSVISKQHSFNDVLPEINNEFTLFTINLETKKVIRNVPPLSCPFGNYSISRSSQILMTQRIGNVSTQQPIILFDQNQVRKVAFITGEGIWKWRIDNFVQTANHDAFNEIIIKTVQYLSLKVDKSFFRVYLKNMYVENEAIQFDAEVYNESYELINEPDINLTIVNESGKKFPYVFSKTNESYYLNAGTFPPGNYGWTATVNINGKVFQEKGVFSVSELIVEMVNTIADHHLLYQLAQNHNGEMIYPANIGSLLKMLSTRDDIKSVFYEQKRYTDIANIFPILLFILGLLSLEWFIRKRSGAY